MYALSFVWNVYSVVTLADTLAEAAFNLATRANGGTKTVNQPKAGDELNDVNNDEDEVVTLPYDSFTIELPLWFEEAWNCSRDPDGERFDLRKVLEELPIVAQIPRKAYNNNHNADGKGYLGKSVKSRQQKLLHALRMLGHLSISEGSENSYVSLLHVFYLLAELEQSLCDFRKTQSVKGSVAHSNQLFTKEELANANLAAKINRLSSKGSSKGSRGKGKGFQSWGNFRQYGKGKSYGRGYGRGSYSSYPQSSTPSAHSGPRGQKSQSLASPCIYAVKKPVAMVGTRRVKHASPLVVSLIKHGLPADWILPPPRPRPLFHTHATEEIQDALAIMQEYLEVKAVRRVNLHSGMHFVPWFMIYKPKPRFISVCVDINARLRPPPYFRLPSWGKIFPYPYLRATVYRRAMAQFALQNYRAQHSALYGSGSWVCNPMS